jgi:hypothetical protein
LGALTGWSDRRCGQCGGGCRSRRGSGAGR